MNEGMIRNLVTRIKGGNPNPVAITKPSSYKPPVPSPAVKAAQAAVDARYKVDVKAGTPAARTARMKAKIAAMKEEALQIDELKISTISSYLKKRRKESDADYSDLQPNNPKSRANFGAKWNQNSKRSVGIDNAEFRLDAHKLGRNPKADAKLNFEPKTVKKNIKNRPILSAYHEKGKAYGNELDALKKKHGMSEEVEQVDEVSRDTAIQAYGMRKGLNSIDPESDRTAKNKRFGKIIANKAKRDVTFKGAKSAGDAVARHVGNAGLGGDDYAKTVYPGPKVYKKHQKNIDAVMKKLDMEESVEQVDEAGPQKKATRLHNKLRDAVRGARYKQTGMPVFEPEAQHKTPQAYNKAIGRALRGMGEEVEQVDETNARHSFTATQQVLTPTKKRILDASSNNPRAKADAKKYEIRASKFSGWSKEEIRAHLRSMRDEVNEGAEYIEERLKASDPTSKWISDFVHSDNPRFKGKTRKERINMALGAYYAKKKGVSEAKLDPVGQEDADVNNDGIKGHSTDKYLMKRRAAISQAIKNKK